MRKACYKCPVCKKQHDYHAENDSVFIYLEDVACNHVFTRCPSNGEPVRVYISPERIVELIQEIRLVPQIFVQAPQGIRIQAAEFLELHSQESKQTAQATDDSPPNELVRELYDNMREFGGTCKDCNFTCGHDGY